MAPAARTRGGVAQEQHDQPEWPADGPAAGDRATYGLPAPRQVCATTIQEMAAPPGGLFLGYRAVDRGAGPCASSDPVNPSPGSCDGIVAANLGRQVEVLTARGEMLLCELARDLGVRPVAGDRVRYRVEGTGAYLLEVAPREREIRRAGRREGEVRVLAAHVDRVLIVSAVEPPLKEGLVDRYLVATHHAGIEPVIVLNKSDLDDGRCLDRLEGYAHLGYSTHYVSALTGRGIQDLRDSLRDRTSALVGHSGVGKSTLLMALIPGVSTPIADISSYSGKGVHTTTTARLWPGPGNLRVIDSPGIRAFGLTGVAAHEVRDYFVEFGAHASHCRFRDCLHIQDEGCAVRAAADGGRISRTRYDSYIRIVKSLEA